MALSITITSGVPNLQTKITLDKGVHLCSCNILQWTSFHSLGAVVHCHHQILLHADSGHQERSNYVNPPLCEGPWAIHWHQFLRRFSNDIPSLLTPITSLDELLRILLQRPPVVTLVQNHVSQSLSSDVRSTISPMNIFQHFLRLGGSQTLLARVPRPPLYSTSSHAIKLGANLLVHLAS